MIVRKQVTKANSRAVEAWRERAKHWLLTVDPTWNSWSC